MTKIEQDVKNIKAMHKKMNRAYTNLVIAKKFLVYSFSEINFKYNDLTYMEKKICTKAEFKALVKWIKEA